MPYIGNTVQVQGFTPAVDYFSGNGVTVTFTLTRPVVSVAQMIVVIDNVVQNPSSAYTVSGNSITFTSAPLLGVNNIWVEYTSLITTYAAISQSPSVIGDITASGGYLANGNFGNTFVDGTIIDYVTGNARITTGPADGITLYNGGTSARNPLLSIDSSGNVGIGTGTGASTPTSPLTLYANRYDVLRIGRYAPASFAVGIPTGSSTDSLEFYGFQSGYDGYVFTGVSGEKLRITSAGNVQLSTANTSILNSSGRKILNQTGSILQVVQTSNNTTATFVRNDYITYLQTSITPSSTSSKILVCVNFGGVSSDSAADLGIIIYRDATALAQGTGASSTNATFIPFMNGGSGDLVSSSFMYLDSPATTSSVAYKFQCAINSPRTMYYNRRGAALDFSCSSSVILMEIAG